jgi:N-acetyl-anhydromuramyl-L-alanine amidase AmpD
MTTVSTIFRASALGLTLLGGALTPARATSDYPLAKWQTSPNYTPYDRPAGRPIQYIVIHDMEGYYQDSINLLCNPTREASCQYCIRSSDGDITQIVLDQDESWHCGNGDINRRSIGIEHEGFATQYTPGGTYYPYTDVMYQKSADLVRYLCDKYNIPTDHNDTLLPGGKLTGGDPGHIFGHAQVPDPNNPTLGGGVSHHWDPGPSWDWDRYMQMVKLYATPAGAWAPSEVHPGQVFGAVLRFRNDANQTWANSGSYPIRIGTAGPLNRVSPFYTAGSWLSVNRPKYLDDFSVVRGGTGSFALTMTAPSTYGTYRESFQPVMDQTPSDVIKQPIWFGEPATVTVSVTPWDIVVDNGDPGFSASERWESQSADGAHGADNRYQLSDAHEIAKFSATLPAAGAYDVYAWWSASPENAPDAPFTIHGDAAPVTVVRDQRVNGGQWVSLGRYHFAAGTAGVHVASRASAGRVVADAVRFVGPY